MVVVASVLPRLDFVIATSLPPPMLSYLNPMCGMVPAASVPVKAVHLLPANVYSILLMYELY